jgi:hypothetical protein
MKQLTIITAALCLVACTTPPAPTEPADPVALPDPVQLVQYQGQGFAFCTQGCPSPTQKVTYMSVDLSADDPRQRILARLRAQMARQAGAPSNAASQASTGIVAIAKSDNTDKPTDAWTIYALHGAPDQPATAAALRRIVEAAPGAKFLLIASEDAQAEAQAYKGALATLGVSPRAMGSFVLQGPLRTDVRIAAPESTSSSAGNQMLVIRKQHGE